jgi:hypothetical protein
MPVIQNHSRDGSRFAPPRACGGTGGGPPPSLRSGADACPQYTTVPPPGQMPAQFAGVYQSVGDSSRIEAEATVQRTIELQLAELLVTIVRHIPGRPYHRRRERVSWDALCELHALRSLAFFAQPMTPSVAPVLPAPAGPGGQVPSQDHPRPVSGVEKLGSLCGRSEPAVAECALPFGWKGDILLVPLRTERMHSPATGKRCLPGWCRRGYPALAGASAPGLSWESIASLVALTCHGLVEGSKWRPWGRRSQRQGGRGR